MRNDLLEIVESARRLLKLIAVDHINHDITPEQGLLALAFVVDVSLRAADADPAEWVEQLEMVIATPPAQVGTA